MDSPAIARAVVEELLASGVVDVVVCPGSRSAPLALTLADAERRGLVRLHVRIDERSGAYLALGIARVSGRPAAVLTTSGTAAVNLHPAIVEAAYSGIPLVAVTADRPSDMRGSGANQTIDQRALYGSDAVAYVDLEGPGESAMRSAIAGALALAASQSGPVHLNVPLPEPLVEPGAHAIGDVIVREQVHAPLRTGAPLSSLLPAGVDVSRGLLIAGDFDDEAAREAAAALASSMGWPVVSEPSGNLASHDHALRHGPLILATPFAEAHVPDVVLTVGRVGLHRSVTKALRATRVHIAVDVPPRLGRVDPARTATVVDAVPVAGGESQRHWLASWQAADDAASAAVDSALADSEITGAAVAAAVARHASERDLLVVGASFPVRHVSSYGGALRARCIGNRGTSGIDGVMSTAWGAALAHEGGTTYALVGDLSAIYDRNGLLAGPGEPQPSLVYVVSDNDGGGIFSSLEQGAADFATDFERVFGTPHGADVASLLAAPGVDVMSVASLTQLRDALASPPSRVRVIVARCASRVEEVAQVRQIQRAVTDAVT